MRQKCENCCYVLLGVLLAVALIFGAPVLL